MGLFDTMKKSKEVNKKAEWADGVIPTIVELNEDYLRLYNSATENNIFYQDIKNVEVAPMIINIKTNVKTFSLRSRKLRGGTDKARELQEQILAKMSECKHQ